MHAAACAVAPELRSGMHGLADGAAAALDSLLDLHDTLLNRVPDRVAAAATETATDPAAAKSNGKKRGRKASAEDDTLSGEQPSPPTYLVHQGILVLSTYCISKENSKHLIALFCVLFAACRDLTICRYRDPQPESSKHALMSLVQVPSGPG